MNQQIITFICQLLLFLLKNGSVKNVAIKQCFKIKSPLKSIHAESNALRYINRSNKFKKCKSFDLVVVRITNGKFTKSCPCRDCIIRLNKANIKIRNIIYINNNSWEIKKFTEFNKTNTKYSSYARHRN